MSAKLSADDVAAELRRRRPDLGAKQLHKLLYYCQGYHLAAFGQELFGDTVSAWNLGPVVGTLWHREKAGEVVTSGVSLDEGHLNTIGYVLSRYGELNGADLEHLTHNELPWLEANSRRQPDGRETITVESMRAYFTSAVFEGGDLASRLLATDEVRARVAGAAERATEAVSVDSMHDLGSRLAALA